jgi:hypothetical protein
VQETHKERAETRPTFIVRPIYLVQKDLGLKRLNREREREVERHKHAVPSLVMDF